MAQNFIGCDREQELLLPPSLREWLPDDHLAWFVLAAVEQMDPERVLCRLPPGRARPGGARSSDVFGSSARVSATTVRTPATTRRYAALKDSDDTQGDGTRDRKRGARAQLRPRSKDRDPTQVPALPHRASERERGRPDAPAWDGSERDDRPRADFCFAMAEQSSEDAAPVQLVLVLCTSELGVRGPARVPRQRPCTSRPD